MAVSKALEKVGGTVIPVGSLVGGPGSSQPGPSPVNQPVSSSQPVLSPVNQPVSIPVISQPVPSPVNQPVSIPVSSQPVPSPNQPVLSPVGNQAIVSQPVSSTSVGSGDHHAVRTDDSDGSRRVSGVSSGLQGEPQPSTGGVVLSVANETSAEVEHARTCPSPQQTTQPCSSLGSGGSLLHSNQKHRSKRSKLAGQPSHELLSTLLLPAAAFLQRYLDAGSSGQCGKSLEETNLFWLCTSGEFPFQFNSQCNCLNLVQCTVCVCVCACVRVCTLYMCIHYNIMCTVYIHVHGSSANLGHFGIGVDSPRLHTEHTKLCGNGSSLPET